MGLCHGNQGLSAVCVTWIPAPRAPDCELPSTKEAPLLAPCLPPIPGLEDCGNCLPRATATPQQRDAYPVKGHC